MAAEHAPSRTLQPVKPAKPTKLPSRTVFADDLIIVSDGAEYRPHAGESVTFRGGRASVQDGFADLEAAEIELEVLQLAAEAKDISEADPEQGTMLARAFLSKREALQQLVDGRTERLASRIISWTWTDPDGTPYDSPPTVAILLSLEPEELAWIKAQLDPVRTAEEQKKDSSAST